jgi:hypothetical protein
MSAIRYRSSAAMKPTAGVLPPGAAARGNGLNARAQCLSEYPAGDAHDAQCGDTTPDAEHSDSSR